MKCYPVIITTTDQAWTDGFGRLYEPFEDEETYEDYAVLHIAVRSDVPHGRIGYYLLNSTTMQEARHSGLILTEASGDQLGFEYPPADPYRSLAEAIGQIQPAPAMIEGIIYPGTLAVPERVPLTLDELLELKARTPKPLMYCLCGSTSRAQQAFEDERLRLTLAYQKVHTIGANAKDTDLGITEAMKVRLDVLHLFKIEDADIVRILNVDGYIGESTRHELEYALRLGKHIEFLEEPALEG